MVDPVLFQQQEGGRLLYFVPQGQLLKLEVMGSVVAGFGH